MSANVDADLSLVSEGNTGIEEIGGNGVDGIGSLRFSFSGKSIFDTHSLLELLIIK